MACDFNDSMVKVTATRPTTASIKLVVGFIAAFFLVVRRAAVDLEVSVRDLHWKNIGLRTWDESCAVLIVDAEACTLAPNLTAEKRCKAGVDSWLHSCDLLLKKSFGCSTWEPCLKLISLRIREWWKGFDAVLPTSEQIVGEFGLLEKVAQTVTIEPTAEPAVNPTPMDVEPSTLLAPVSSSTDTTVERKRKAVWERPAREAVPLE